MLNPSEQARFCKARRAVIEKDFAHLNPEQRRAVLATEGPLLLLAGAGSGKTTVLINRVANQMKYGRGSDCDEVSDLVTADDLTFLESYAAKPTPEGKDRAERLCRVDPAVPWSILAITFTNKAAGELKARLERMLGPSANDIWASTFHSCCARILRRDIDKLGYATSFTIYDTADSERVIKDILKERNIDDKAFPPKTVLGYISRAKDAMKPAADYVEECNKTGDYRLQKIAGIYAEYEKRLKAANALDFDDLIFCTVRLLQQDEETRSYYQRKFRYVLVDEYQDTNNMQYQLSSLLAGGYENFCVVGDDDQSIYRFRGATIENILSFENQYKDCRTIRLEQNYRSTQNILKAANSVIQNNTGRKGKELWTQHGEGDKLQLYTAMNQDDEARYVASEILSGYSGGRHWKDFAVLYRMNAQSRELEMAFKRNGVPYRIIGGTRFFDRAEVKDMLAYLCVINNPGDDLRLQRIINNPPRGIGQKTVDTAQQLAVQTGRSLWEVISHARDYPDLQKAAAKLAVFTGLITNLRQQAGEMSLTEFYDVLCADSGYAIALEAKDTVEDRTRLENVRELQSSIQNYLDNAEEPSLSGFLDEIALYTDLDNHDPNEESVVMMTMHSAKGLEFPVVFVVGAEEGIFPGIRSIGDAEEMEEERRLCYVAMTRAKERLYMVCANQRMLYGRTSSNRPSRFLEEIPEEHVERSGQAPMSGQWRIEESSWRPEREFYDEEESGYSYGEGHRSGGYSYGGSGYPSSGGYSSGGGYQSRRPACGQSRPGGGSPVSRPARSKQSILKAAAKAAPPLPDFQKGEMVMHKAFGKGMILSLSKMGGDALVEIAFDNVGTKKLMLKSAAQYMEKL
ncbi:MAG: UvrD-helicase domain-containing protein [Oscillospiraceae bacterium]|jgi:DNA helicase-2/ATP-dependent DNA helicase PcrA|nr:UvrD-helicase domain-containing protein [Oscillospiraceae bacterium]